MPGLPAWAQPSCANMPAASVAAGAATRVTGLDSLFVGWGAPPAVHWALGGVAADYACKGAINPDQDTAMNMAWAWGGGMVASMLFR